MRKFKYKGVEFEEQAVIACGDKAKTLSVSVSLTEPSYALLDIRFVSGNGNSVCWRNLLNHSEVTHVIEQLVFALEKME